MPCLDIVFVLHFIFCTFFAITSVDCSHPKITLSKVIDKEWNLVNFISLNNTIIEIPKSLSEIIKFEFYCISDEPSEWVFECPYDIWFDVVNISKIVVKKRSQLTFRSILTINPPSPCLRNKNECEMSNVTCRIIDKHNLNSSLLFPDNSADNKRYTMKIHEGYVLDENLTQYCQKHSTNSTKCFDDLKIDYETSLYNCSPNFSQLNIFDCNLKDDFCSSYLNWNENNCTKEANISEIGFGKLLTLNANGIAECRASTASVIVTPFYRILDSNRNKSYRSRNEALWKTDPKVLLKIKTKTKEFYIGSLVEIECVKSTSYFAFGSLLFHNASSRILLDNVTEKLDESKHSIITSAVFTAQENSSQIICHAPILNSKHWINASYLFNLSNIQPKGPEIVNTSKFKTGNTTTFICKAIGSPLPNITWYKIINMKIPIQKERGIAKGVPLGESKLDIKNYTDFPVVCKAQNSEDIAEFTFTSSNVSIIANSDNITNVKTIIVTGTVVAILVICIAFVIIFIQQRHKKNSSGLSEDELDAFYKGTKSIIPEMDALQNALLMAYDIRFEVARKSIKMEEKVLGAGQFGIVVQGKYRGETVAIKTIRPTADIAYFKALLSELKILQYLNHHPNIVNLIGACTSNIRKMEILLLLDYCENGNLVKFLRDCRSSFVDLFHYNADDKIPFYQNKSVYTLTTKNLVKIAYEIASAMDFIAQKNILHGDLAARNILITADKHAKICDFGLAKQLFHYSVYIQKKECPLPLRWMAIESLQDMEFSISSDIWSFGIVLWEIFSLAEIPYPGVTWSFESWRMLKDGYRLEKPDYANISLYLLMKECWKLDPKERPPFVRLAKALQTELDLLRE